MPTYEIEFNGKTYEVEAPNATAAAAAFGPATRPQPAPANLSGQAAAVGAMPAHAPNAVQPQTGLGQRLGQSNSNGAVGSSTTQPIVSEKSMFPITIGQWQEQLREEPWAKKQLAGFAAGGLGLPVLRLAQMAGENVPDSKIDEQRVLADAGRLGSFAGTLGSQLVPFNKGLQAAKTASNALPSALGIRSAAQSLEVPAVSAAATALTEPVRSDESIGGKMLTSALMAKGGEMGARTLGRTLTGLVKPSEEAEALMKLGIQPSAGAGGEGFWAGATNLGQNMRHAFLKKEQDLANRRFQQNIADVAGQRAHANPPPTIEDVSRGDYIPNLKKDASDAYDLVLQGKTWRIPNGYGDSVATNAANNLIEATPQMRDDLKRTIRGMLPDGGILNQQQMKAKLENIRGLVRSHSKEANTKGAQLTGAWEAVENGVEALRNQRLTPEEIARVSELDKVWKHTLLMENAVNLESPNIGTNLVKTVESLTDKEKKVALQGFFQDITEPLRTKPELLKAHENLDPIAKRLMYGAGAVGLGGSAIISPWALVPGAALWGLGKVGASEKGARFLLGGNDWQKSLAEQLRNYIPPAAVAFGND